MPRGEAGEVVGRSANLMSGYLNRPDDTAAALLQVGDGPPFFKTGDLGRFDEDGFLYLLDRKKDVIISGGFNVYATDLEAVLLGHPGRARGVGDRRAERALGRNAARSDRAAERKAAPPPRRFSSTATPVSASKSGSRRSKSAPNCPKTRSARS